jgi:ribosomal-protein-alanine N-acetyltransferase
MPTVIETPRLRMREMTRDDLDFLSEMLADPEVMRYYPRPLDRAGAQAWMDRQLERYERDGFGFWLVEEADTGQSVGQVGLLKQTVEGTVHREVAYMIHRPYQRNGFATEAATAVRDHAFEVLDVSEVVSFIRPENLPSQRVARHLGMEPRRMIVHAGLSHLLWVVRSKARPAGPGQTSVR